MITRLLCSNVGRRIIKTHGWRLLRTTTLAAASSHDEPLPVYVPKPAIGERNWLGSVKAPPEQFPHEPYRPGKSDLLSFLGAGLGVALTVLAVTFYNDIFGESPVKKVTLKDAHHHELPKESSQVAQIEAEEVKAVEHDALLSHENVDNHPTRSTEQLVPKLSSERNEESGEVRTVESTQEQSSHKETHEDISSREQKPPYASEEGSSPEDKPSHFSTESSSPEHQSFHVHVEPALLSEDKGEHVSTTVMHENNAPNYSKGEKVPEFVEYLLVGAGTAAYYASLAIRARHADARVLMIGEEEYLPYNRPPLSKELWWYSDGNVANTLQYTGINGKKRDVFFEADGFFVPPAELATTAHGGVSLLKGRRVKRLCPDEKKAYLDDNTCVKYDKCLIATGGKPKTLPELENSAEVRDKVVYLRGVEDYRKLESMCSSSNSITVVGGGFLGSELAYSIHRKYGNVEVNQLVAEDGLLSGILPDYLSSKAAESLRENGVNVITNAKITSACVKDAKVVLEVNGTQKMTSDCVVVAIGVEPDTSIAKASGLEVDDRIGGIVTDTELRVRSGVWAAGDAASFYDRSLGRRRIEHWENAQISGRLAGENMTGAGKAFWYQPSFFTKIAPSWHINAVGNTDSSLNTVSVFAKDASDKENYDRGVVFYKGEDGKVVGVLLLNVFGSGVDVARRIIEEGRSIEDFQQLAKLFSLYKLAQTEDKEN